MVDGEISSNLAYGRIIRQQGTLHKLTNCRWRSADYKKSAAPVAGSRNWRRGGAAWPAHSSNSQALNQNKIVRQGVKNQIVRKADGYDGWCLELSSYHCCL